MKVEFCQATFEHVLDLAPRLREADKMEIQARSGRTPLAGLTFSFETSDIRISGFVDGQLVCIFGTAPSGLPNTGSVWLLGSDEIQRYRREFLVEAKRWVNPLHVRYPLLFNFVDARNTVHIRWLRWLGFSFLKLHNDFGFEHRPFWEFARIKPHDV